MRSHLQRSERVSRGDTEERRGRTPPDNAVTRHASGRLSGQLPDWATRDVAGIGIMGG